MQFRRDEAHATDEQRVRNLTILLLDEPESGAGPIACLRTAAARRDSGYIGVGRQEPLPWHGRSR